MVRCWPRGSLRGVSRRTPPAIPMVTPGGITYTWFGSTAIRSRTSVTGMVVARDRISVSMLAWVGSRWRIKTNAMPVSVGRAWTIWLKASRPPAEAPMPTMGNCAPGVLLDSGATCTGSGGEAGESGGFVGGRGESETPFVGLSRLLPGFFRGTATSSPLLGSAAVSRNDQSKARPEEDHGICRALLDVLGSKRSSEGRSAPHE